MGENLYPNFLNSKFSKVMNSTFRILNRNFNSGMVNFGDVSNRFCLNKKINQ